MTDVKIENQGELFYQKGEFKIHKMNSSNQADKELMVEVGLAMQNSLATKNIKHYFEEDGDIYLASKNDEVEYLSYVKNGKPVYFAGEKQTPVKDKKALDVFYEFNKKLGCSKEDFKKASIFMATEDRLEYEKNITEFVANKKSKKFKM